MFCGVHILEAIINKDT